jgi:hypothetical protein
MKNLKNMLYSGLAGLVLLTSCAEAKEVEEPRNESILDTSITLKHLLIFGGSAVALGGIGYGIYRLSKESDFCPPPSKKEDSGAPDCLKTVYGAGSILNVQVHEGEPPWTNW